PRRRRRLDVARPVLHLLVVGVGRLGEPVALVRVFRVVLVDDPEDVRVEVLGVVGLLVVLLRVVGLLRLGVGLRVGLLRVGRLGVGGRRRGRGLRVGVAGVWRLGVL